MALVSEAARDLLEVVERREIADGVIELTLQRPDRSRLPDWAPGAHIDLILGDGTTRQYSLCGDRWDAHTYRVAVQREAGGRGGSAAIHDNVRVGSGLRFGGPRNNFRLAPAEEYLFVAGGIGITPIMPMIRQAELLDVPWRLLFLASTRARLAYLPELDAYGDRVTTRSSEEVGRTNLEEWRPADPRVRVYSCGPARLLDVVVEWGAAPGGYAPRVERFAADAGVASAATEFEVVAARSGVSATVGRDETVVAALARVGVEVLTSCAQGVCGTCETDVIEGTPDHRDTLLEEDERIDAGCMFPCVSRCQGARLVLDL